ncbi:TetR/AcrR family transcriptional regulator [Bacillus mycoides]|uniref:TetR/AcrR family transcriptional regulator n=1 Tax=Bacillus mycoides TaxID=1405 RepID=UPI001C02F76F|nr:TetR/AcrR family transcriptional regulator [Bacillus mycoides]MED1381845.1 TetR/AcrR family transcriptional regulator [Bacillus mycoides]QWH78436.1 TetR/AcrR family transcriptional regulator [Bacillus mycoides]QWI43483.1 TetR/AcrR family transcriptional regulator [Bacillus mycoides]
MEEDVRVYKTKKNISNTLITLLNEKEFGRITTKDICIHAMVSKSTFYSHFADKYDLLEKLVQNYVCWFKEEIEFRFALIENGNVAQAINMITDKISARKKEVATLLHVRVPSADLRLELEFILYNACYSYLKEQQVEVSVPIDFVAQLYTANAMVSINWSLSNDKNPDVVELIDNMQGYVFDLILSGGERM